MPPLFRYEAGIWPFKTKIVMEKGEPHLEGTLKIQFLNTFNKAVRKTKKKTPQKQKIIVTFVPIY